MPTTHRPAAARERLDELRRLKELVAAGPDLSATERQHDKGKLTARERIALLLDKGSFTEVEPLRRHRASGFGLEARRTPGDGVVTGWGTVDGRTVYVYAQDPAYLLAPDPAAGLQKTALRLKELLIGILESDVKKSRNRSSLKRPPNV